MKRSTEMILFEDSITHGQAIQTTRHCLCLSHAFDLGEDLKGMSGCGEKKQLAGSTNLHNRELNNLHTSGSIFIFVCCALRLLFMKNG